MERDNEIVLNIKFYYKILQFCFNFYSVFNGSDIEVNSKFIKIVMCN